MYNVSAYITAFRRAANRVVDLSDAEAMDHFVRGLQPTLRKDVLLRDPDCCKAAMRAAKRISAIYAYVQHPRQQSFPKAAKDKYYVDTSVSTRSGGPAPMVLG